MFWLSTVDLSQKRSVVVFRQLPLVVFICDKFAFATLTAHLCRCAFLYIIARARVHVRLYMLLIIVSFRSLLLDIKNSWKTQLWRKQFLYMAQVLWLVLNDYRYFIVPVSMFYSQITNI